jgi:hypothetical protein
MKKEKQKPVADESIEVIAKQEIIESAAPKKKKKTKQIDETPAAAVKNKKTTPVKEAKKAVDSKDLKMPKEDKLNKFLVSMKKSLRKSIKKEAAEVGISMNEYIVLAVEEKLGQDSSK